MHVLARHEEGQWPYANILPTTKDTFEEALDQTNIIDNNASNMVTLVFHLMTLKTSV